MRERRPRLLEQEDEEERDQQQDERREAGQDPLEQRVRQPSARRPPLEGAVTVLDRCDACRVHRYLSGLPLHCIPFTAASSLDFSWLGMAAYDSFWIVDWPLPSR